MGEPSADLLPCLLSEQLPRCSSGFVIPALSTNAEFCGRLCSATGTVVFDCDYRKAPEHPFPSALHDLEDILAHVRSKPEQYDLHRISIGGFSAGGNLAVSLASTRGPSDFLAVCGFYASVDLSKEHTAPKKEHDSGVNIPPFARRFFYRCLAVDPEDLKSTRISPFFAKTEAFPRHVFLACGQADALHDPAKDLVERLKTEGHPDTEFLSVEREAHSFDQQTKKGSASAKRKDEMYDAAIEFLRKAQAEGR